MRSAQLAVQLCTLRDTYWIQAGGGNPAAWCARLPGRMPALHMKEYAISEDRQAVFAEVGQGNMDGPGIVEQDTCPDDPFASIRSSYEFIKDHLCSS